MTEALDKQWSDKDQMLLQDNTRFVQHREQEINGIVQSIGQLNIIFKDLAQVITSPIEPLIPGEVCSWKILKLKTNRDIKKFNQYHSNI